MESDDDGGRQVSIKTGYKGVRRKLLCELIIHVIN